MFAHLSLRIGLCFTIRIYTLPHILNATETPILISTPGRFMMWQSCFYGQLSLFIKGLQNIGCMNYSWAKIFLSLMSITMLELCSYGQKRQLYSINIERCPRENDTPFHRNLWLTCYHDLRTGVLFQAVWLIHLLNRFIN